MEVKKAISMVLCGIQLMSISAVNIQFNMSDYYRMPTLNAFDNYHECMGLYGDEALFCVADTFIKPDLNSELYNFIVHFSSDTKKHFRHDNLVRGLCLNTCKVKVDKLRAGGGNYLVEKFPIDSKIIYDSVEYFNSKEDRIKHANVINECVNIELEGKYKLRGFSVIEYCINESKKPPIDALDIFAVVLVISLLTLMVISSLIDRYLRNVIGSDADDHYKNTPENDKHRLLTLFSIRRNWNTLTAPGNPDYHDLGFIQAIRTLTMLLIVIGHTFYYAEMIPVDNPEAIEGSFGHLPSMVILNGLLFAQTFFVISGFLSSYLFMMRHLHDKSSSLNHFFNFIVIRYLRIAPLLAIAILLQSTWLTRLTYGPIANKVNYAEQQFCRKHWWKNLLFIANYTKVPEQCLIQSWYLCAEFWLSISATTLLVIVKKKPAPKTWLLSVILGFSALINGYAVYSNGYEPISIFPPETLKNRLVPVTVDEVNYFADWYTPTHFNIGNYFIGVAIGFYFYDLKKSGRTFPKNWWLRSLWYLSLGLAIINIASIYLCYNYDLDKSTVGVAILAVILKHSWGLLFGYIAFTLVNRFGWFISNIFSHSAWRILGRLSYPTFVLHSFVVQLLMFDIYQPVHTDAFKYINLGLGATFFSSVLGLYFALSVELPLASIIKWVLYEEGKVQLEGGINMIGQSETTPMNLNSMKAERK